MGYPTGKKEMFFLAGILCGGMLLVNSLVFGGLNLGAAAGVCLCILCSFCYLMSRGKKRAYPIALLVLSLVLGASFARADDTGVKWVLAMLMLVSVNLALCLLAEKNKHNPGTALALLDSLGTLVRGFRRIGDACVGIGDTCRNSRGFGKKGRSVLLGLGIALPLVLILVPVLMAADAAFEGLMDRMPSVSLKQILLTVSLGGGFGLVLYARAVSLKQPELTQERYRTERGLSSATVNTVLMAVCGVYLVYLVSQLAYFSGGFSGILPEEYTLAEYARRGFFEMAWLCGLNLSIMVGALWVSLQKDPAPRLTRFLCLFLGLMTLFLVCTASAKMLLYIRGYGLTRLRVLTQVIMVFLGLVTVFVCLWLFVRKMPYMKCVLVTALVLAALVSWVDVDTLVAKYNTQTYLSGQMKTVDTRYLDELGDGAVLYLVRLYQEAPDQWVREAAWYALEDRAERPDLDLRDWNYASDVAQDYLDRLFPDVEPE